jgi:predicted RNA-binding protein YlxR (DUF448 family)
LGGIIPKWICAMGRKPIKHVPQRTCVGCRKVLAKRTLIRIVRTPEGVKIDPSGKLSGRGAYLHNQRSCWEKGIKGALAHNLKIDLTDKDIEHLKSYLINIPEEIEDEAAPSS